MPTQIVMECLDILLPIITQLINFSFDTVSFPEAWKEALLKPLLKKDGLNLLFKNYRPVNDLSFVSKITERSASNQLHSRMSQNGLYPILQSGYRKHHSTETAWLNIKNDILMNMNEGHVTLLVLLDLSAAFDTIDHNRLLEGLRSRFGGAGLVFILLTK